jgi:hypothetical protein
VIMAKNLLTDKLSEPLNGATTARVDIHAGDGNLTIDGLDGGEQVLASGTLQYFENRGLPTRSLVSDNGQATFTLRGSGAGRPWFHFPWSACNGATEWQIHLNPNVASDITATAMAATSSWTCPAWLSTASRPVRAGAISMWYCRIARLTSA